MGILLPAILVMVAGVSFAMPQVFSSHAAGVQHKKHHKHQNNQQQKHP